MGIQLFASSSVRVPQLDFELTPACDHRCGHCYNVWNADSGSPQAGYPRGQLRTEAFLAMMGKAVAELQPEMIVLTGGEPLLRKDALEIVEKACSLAPRVMVVSNGSHLSENVASQLGTLGVEIVQLTLLSAERELHNQLKGADCFDDTMRSMLRLRAAGVRIQLCFVSMSSNWAELEGVMELGFALGATSLSYNRMAPSGWAVEQAASLVPTVDQVKHNLATANRLGPLFGMEVATAMPIPPCLIRLEDYPHVRFGFCPTGGKVPDLVIDPLGNVRSCNLSSTILGNILEQDCRELLKHPYPKQFRKTVPDFCRGCAYEFTCQGGCKESAFATFGSLAHPEPFLHLALNPDWAQRRAAQSQASLEV